MNRIFFSQRILDSLTDESKIKLDKNVITLLLSPGTPSFELEPAYTSSGLQTAARTRMGSWDRSK